MNPLRTAVRRDVGNDVTIIVAAGILSPYSMTNLRAALMTCIAECPAAVIVDMSNCRVESPAALAVFPAVAREASPERPLVTLLLVEPTGYIADNHWYAAVGAIATYRDLAKARVAARVRRVGLARVGLGLRRSLAAPGQARAAVKAACARWGIEHVSRAAQLIVSELVTNAVIHAGTEVGFEAVLRGDFLHLRVRDGSISPPMFTQDEKSAAPPVGADGDVPDHGRGLPIVRDLSSGWGYVLDDEGDGKVVWATLRLRRRDGRPATAGRPTPDARRHGGTRARGH